ncbi:hypothetical protein CO641_14060 [Lysobacteraceae bacterium NML91-0213]|nr:hypothetical protein CO641_14060 [Xanthomonadaceae bacterium NML91-0213]
MQYGDSAQHFLGWMFYRLGPWTFPIGLNPAYGLEMSSSIVYSDSIPLLAIFFKIFESHLPESFQYFGLWVLACFVLQAWFGFKLARIVSPDLLVRALICTFFAIAPPMLFRLGGHLALAGHFLILAGLYSCLARPLRRRILVWSLLIAVAALVHAYLLLMLLVIWGAGLFDRVLHRETDLRRALVECATVIGVLSVVAWQAGYFAVSGGTAAWGYGFYRMNLLSPVDPNDWSRVLPDLPGGGGDGEGFAYFGLGMLMLFGAGGWGLLMRRPPIIPVLRRNIVLIAAALLLTVYAWSDQIGVGFHSLDVGYAGWLGGIQDTFRATGRFFWPAYYLLMLAGAAAVTATFKPTLARWILGLCLIVQIWDTSAGWRALQGYRAEPATSWETQLSSPFWTVVDGRYDTLRALPPSNRQESWSQFAALAASLGMASDIVYLARIDEPGFHQQVARASALIESGDFHESTLYILDESVVERVRRVVGPNDFIANVDGFHVLVPNGLDCRPCLDSAGSAIESIASGRVEDWSFANGSNYELLVEGWSAPESWGVWSDGATSRIQLPFAPSPNLRLTISGYAYGPNAGADIGVRIGRSSGTLRLSATPDEVALDLPNPDGASTIELLVPAPASPSSLGEGEDQRKLGVALISLRVQEYFSQTR